MNEQKPIDSKEKAKLEERQIVVFNIGDEEFGVNISEVWKIIRMEQITKIPNTDRFIKGVINLRGGIVVIIDLAMKLGFPNKEDDKNTRIIVIELKENIIGMIVDSATEMMRLSPEQVKPAPPMITQKISGDYIEGVGIINERLLILLDLAKILEAKDIKSVNLVGSTKEAAEIIKKEMKIETSAQHEAKIAEELNAA
jgi:purine-binding chemotaxis protein CheW